MCYVNDYFVMIQLLDNDSITHIVGFLSYNESIRFKIAICDKENNSKEYFMNSKIFANSIFLKLNPFPLYSIVKYSLFNTKMCYDVLDFIDTGRTNNGEIPKLRYQNLEGKVTRENIKNSVHFVKICLEQLEKKIEFASRDESKNIYFYYGLYIYLNDKIINLFIDIMKAKYNLKVGNMKLMKFRLQLYESCWYLSNFNIYILFVLYLINLDILPEDLLKSFKYCKRKKFHILDKASEKSNDNYNIHNLVNMFYLNSTKQFLCNILDI